MMTLRIETVLLTLLILKPLVAIPLPAPPLPQLPAPRIAGLLPERAESALSRAERRLRHLDGEILDVFETALEAALSAKRTPIPLF